MKKFVDPYAGIAFDTIEDALDDFCKRTLAGNNCGSMCAIGSQTFQSCQEWAKKHPDEAADIMSLDVEEAEAEPVDKPFTGEIPGDVCSDNRFELIEEYKTKLINGTNIGAVKEEMAVIDNILFRFWQMGWLDTLEKAYAPTMNTKNMGEKTGDSPTRPRLAEVLGVEVGEKFTFYDRELWVDEQGLMHDLDGCVSGYTVCDVVNHPESIIRAPRITEPEITIMRSMGAKWVSTDAKSCTGLKADLWDVEPYKTQNGVYVVPNADPIARVKIELFPSVKPGECIGLEEVER